MRNLPLETLTVWPTLTSCYAPVEKYLDLLALSGSFQPQPVVKLQSLDAFLMYQIASCLPSAPAVIDLSADATCGASAVLWLSSRAIETLIAPRPGWATGENEDRTEWRKSFAQLAKTLDLDCSGFDPESEPRALDVSSSGGWAEIEGRLNPVSPVLATLGQAEEDARLLAQRLHTLFLWRPEATVLVLPIGLIGESPLLKAALDFCAGDSRYRLTVAREISPFFATSRLGVIARSDRADLFATFDRLRQMYEGNFQFLALAREVTAAALQNATRNDAPPLIIQDEEPMTFPKLKYEIKRWLWHRVFPLSFKRGLNLARGRPADQILERKRSVG